MRRRAVRAAMAATMAVVVLAAGCSSSADDSSTPATSAIRAAGPPAEGVVPVPAVQGPVTGGKGATVLGPGGFDLATVGYQQEEYFISGDATSYVADGALASDGNWTVSKGTTAPYTTRVVVRRPIDAADFDGTVFVEWLNVSGGLDASPDWTYAHVELIRSGAAWVGVSAQQVGILGGGNAVGAALALKNADPERYAALVHPGDDYSYDMYSQAGSAVWAESAKLLGPLRPERVLAIGESQSAFRLSTYVNAVAPTTGVYNGYLIHSRSAVGAPLADGVQMPDPTLTRTDLDVPVLNFSSETDLVGDRLGYGRARQPDTNVFRSWEVPGSAHADAYNLGIGDGDDGSGAADAVLFAAMQAPPSSIYGGVITCATGINTGPHTYVLRSAVHALDQWVRTGQAPSSMPQVELTSDGSVVRDAQGIALGGIRTPQVDVPVATLSGEGQTGSRFCGLFGTTVPFSTEQLQAAHSTHEQFVTAWVESLDAAVATGAVQAADADNLRTVVQQSSVLR